MATPERAEPPRRAVIFESYGWGDAEEIARRIRASLEEAEYDVWIDREHLKRDDPLFPVELQKALENCGLVVALLSPHSVRLEGDIAAASRMSWCQNELIFADHRDMPVVPVTVVKLGPDLAIPFAINKYEPIDFTNWHSPDTYSAGIKEILHWIEEGLRDPPRRKYCVYVDNLSGARLSVPEERTAEGGFVGREWLMDRLGAWLASDRRCFLIEAEPGSGKTAFVAELVRRNPAGSVVAYHFCSHKLKETLDARTFVRSLAAMLCGTVRDYRKLLRSSKDGPDLVSALKTDNDAASMLEKGVLAPLRDVPMEGARCIVVDALDEAIDASGMSIPLLLSEALDYFPAWLKLIVTTRLDDRVPKFRSVKRCSLGESDARQRDDLRQYIERRLKDPALLKRCPDESVRDRTATEIAERSAGNFQYATMVLDELKEGEIPFGEIKGLPSSLADLYENRAALRFHDGGFAEARTVLSVLLAARQPLNTQQLADITGLDRYGTLYDTLNKLSCFVTWGSQTGDERLYQPAHRSITDWLIAPPVGSDRFRVDPAKGSELILPYCRGWATNHDTYALTHLIGHLLEGGFKAEALAVVRDGFFAKRRAHIRRDPKDIPRCDFEDTRDLTLALVVDKDHAAILELAQTDDISQRDGVAAALQSAPSAADDFVDGVVDALLRVS
jgi:hypothetical protein